jgi:hypothetical protein
MKTKLKNSNGKPGLIAWFLGGASGLVLVASCSLIFLGASESSRYLGYRSLEQSILARNWSGVLQSYRKTSRPVGSVEGVLRRLVSLTLDESFKAPDKAAKSFKIVNLLKANNFTSAAVEFEGEKDRLVQHLMVTGGYEREKLSPEAFINSTDEMLDGLLKAREQITDSSTILRNAEDEKTALLQRLVKISQDTADFFSLRPLPVTVAADGTLPLYSTGILQDLPLLRGIPDGVTSASDLDEHVQRAFGRVKIEPGEDAPVHFRRSILALRKAAEAVIEDWDLATQREAEAQSRIKEIYRVRTESRDELERRFLWIVKSQLKDSGKFAIRLKNLSSPLSSISDIG